MTITIKIEGNKATVKCGEHQEEMKKTWLLKQFKLNDLYQYMKSKNGSTTKNSIG